MTYSFSQTEKLLITRDRLETVLRALLEDQIKLQMIERGIMNYDVALVGYNELITDDVMRHVVSQTIKILMEDAGVI